MDGVQSLGQLGPHRVWASCTSKCRLGEASVYSIVLTALADLADDGRRRLFASGQSGLVACLLFVSTPADAKCAESGSIGK